MKKTALFLVLLMTFFQVSVSAEGFEKTFEVNVTDEDVKAVIFTVLKPNDTGVTDFSQLTPENLEGAVYTYEFYERDSRADETVTFHLTIPEDQPRGSYPVRITLVNEVPEKTISTFDKVEIMDEEDVLRLYEAPANEVLGILQEFVEEQEYFPLEDLETAKTTENFGEYYVASRTAYFKEGYVDAVADITENVQIALLAESLLTKSDTMDQRIRTYGQMEQFGLEDYITLSDELLNRVMTDYKSKTNIGEYAVEQAITELRSSIGLSIFNYGSVAQKADALLTYYEEIGIDEITDEAHRLGIARFLSGTFDSWEDLGVAVETADQKYKDEISSEDQSSPNRGSGGGSSSGSGGGGIVAVVDPPAPTQTPDDTEQVEVYDDLSGYDWAKEDIIELTEKQIVNGFDGSFRPQLSVSRAEFCKLIAAAFNLESTQVSETFYDVKNDQWFYPYVMAAYQAGIVNGVTETEFLPDAPITRQDIAAIVSRLPELKNKLPQTELSFTDADVIADYAKDAVAGLTGAGILNGYDDGTFQSNANASRAEAAVIICRLLRYVEGIQV